VRYFFSYVWTQRRKPDDPQYMDVPEMHFGCCLVLEHPIVVVKRWNKEESQLFILLWWKEVDKDVPDMAFEN
jgi:hypothetical protein